jgi:hypothetical protein
MKQLKLFIIIITITGFMNKLQAQKLASEKPVASSYSKTTQEKLRVNVKDRQPAAQKARQALPSEKPIDMDKINRLRARKKPD